jgi:hypothetical protein
MNVETLTTPSDLTSHAFADAIARLRCMPDMAVVYCSSDWAADAYKIREEYKCAVMLIPREIIQRDHWAVVYGDSMVWSTGA